MAGWKDFREIAAWQRAEQLKVRVYVEVLNHFIDARDQGLLTNDELLVGEHHVRRALKTTVGLIRHLESSEDPPRPPKKPREEAKDENL